MFQKEKAPSMADAQGQKGKRTEKRYRRKKSNLFGGISQVIMGFALSLLIEILFYLNWPKWQFLSRLVDRLTIAKEGGHEG